METSLSRLNAETILDPKNAFDALFEDLSQQMRDRGVNENAIEGMQIGLMLAFRLGERAGQAK